MIYGLGYKKYVHTSAHLKVLCLLKCPEWLTHLVYNHSTLTSVVVSEPIS